MESDKLSAEEIHKLAIAPFKSDLCLRKDIIKSPYLVGSKVKYDPTRNWRSEIKE